jgi:OOP family OmpA-OmpF porin
MPSFTFQSQFITIKRRSFLRWIFFQEIDMQKFLLTLLISMTLIAPVAAQAEGSYLKFSMGRSEYKNNDGASRETAASLAYGFRVDKNFGVEMGYIDFGKVRESGAGYSNTTQRQALYLAGVGSVSVADAFSLFAKLGLAINRYEDKLVSIVTNETEKVTKVRPMWGLGATYQFSKELAGVLEYQHLGEVGSADIKTSALTLGIQYGF